MTDPNSNKKSIPPEAHDDLIKVLQNRFEKNMQRHPDLKWADIHSRLEKNAEKMTCLYEMERTGGEPDVVGYNPQTGEYSFYDCAAESPLGRRNVCYDRAGWEERKTARPENTAVDLAAEIGIELLTEEQYRELQQLGEFDTKTSSWLKTPAEVRKLGGALFADRRFGRVFVYHNTAPSYYGVRGFRGCLKV